MKLQMLFDVVICKNPISKAYAEENPGNTAYVTTTSLNNGVDCYVDYPAQYDAYMITVSKDGGSADAFLQTEPFCGNEKVMVLIPKEDLALQELLFYTYVINVNKYKFAYGRKCSVARLNDMDIPKKDEIPDWVYKTDISKVKTSNKERISLNEKEWKEFRFGDYISEIYKAKAINKDELTIEDDDAKLINYITRTSEENGCELQASFVDIDDSFIENGNAITIGDTTATCFYQEESFITGDHMVVVRADWLNKYTGLFIVTLLTNEQYKYSYGRAYLMDRIKETMLKLPATEKDGNIVPDWQFMEDYIRSLPYGDRL